MKYRVFHKLEIFPGKFDIRPFDLRDRNLDKAIEVAQGLDLGHVRPKGSRKIAWSALS